MQSDNKRNDHVHQVVSDDKESTTQLKDSRKQFDGQLIVTSLICMLGNGTECYATKKWQDKVHMTKKCIPRYVQHNKKLLELIIST